MTILYQVEYEECLVSDGNTSISDAEKSADEWWEDKHDYTSDIRVGETRDAKVWIVGVNDCGEEVSHDEHEVSFTCPPSDYDEHHTMWGL